VSALPALERRAGELLLAHKRTFAAVESCTGGLILHRMTNIPGSSAYVLGGFVTYSNAAKMKFAHVQAATLEAYGAVSEPTALEMVRGVREAFGADYAVSATGIVGPGGGSIEKPVGLVYIGLATPFTEIVVKHNWPDDRETNKQHTTNAALGLLIAFLEQES
jgi:PncC family amidohydrolase